MSDGINLTQATAVEQSIQQATHWLPSQGPISVFVHHNTLHAFEQQSFEEAVVAGGELYHCEPYLSEHRFRQELACGRIRLADLQSVLLEDLGEEAGQLVASFGTRYALRLDMLQFPLQTAPDAELQWVIAETQAHRRFRAEVPAGRREQMIAANRAWILKGLSSGWEADGAVILPLLADLLQEKGKIESWSDNDWEAFTLRFLWRVVQVGVGQVQGAGQVQGSGHVAAAGPPRFVRFRDLLLSASGRDSDRLVDEVMIRFTAAFLDQGFSDWPLPHRDLGFFQSFARLYACKATPVAPWLRGLRQELQQILQEGITPLQSIVQSLAYFGVSAAERDGFILHSLLALRGWAGLIWQLESNAPWAPQPAPAGTLQGYLAVRLILERYALQSLVRQEWPSSAESAEVKLAELRRSHSAAEQRAGSETPHQTAFTFFQLAQVRGWSPHELIHLVPAQWRQLLKELQSFSSIERRRVFHLAYERQYRIAALDAILNHRRQQLAREASVQSTPAEAHARPTRQTPAFQIVCCIDDREESFRRHLEEVEPDCETFAAAGFFAVAMYYQGAAEAHWRPLCPIIITPQHYIREEPVFSATAVSETRSHRRRLMGRMTHTVHARSRTLMGGMVTGLLGSLATFPLVARILAPRMTAQLRATFGSFVKPPATELHIERIAPQPGPEFESQGYSIDEMAGIVTRILQDIGLVTGFAPLVVFTGHGSSSLNNPHESAYNCGACSGGRGGPNARSFALMANDPRVRQLVAAKGIAIPEGVRFVGAYHNTCNDQVEYYDLDQLPRSHRPLFRRVEQCIDSARARNAHERSRRFESAPLTMSVSQALEHVEERAEDLSQARPEYNHATNALCFVGRRQWSRGLFLDRRAFLTSYDPRIDDAQASILGRILAAAIPVCAGISLEYLFSTIDNEGYGCGSKLPHNIAALAGVMAGAASDIRPGLSAQMVEIHEPLRILFVVETTQQKMLQLLRAQPGIDHLVRQRWVQLAVYDAELNQLQLFVAGQFVDYHPENESLPSVVSSHEWYGGFRGHLGFASITPPVAAAAPEQSPSEPRVTRERVLS